jgi:hypothetical protein
MTRTLKYIEKVEYEEVEAGRAAAIPSNDVVPIPVVVLILWQNRLCDKPAPVERDRLSYISYNCYVGQWLAWEFTLSGGAPIDAHLLLEVEPPKPKVKTHKKPQKEIHKLNWREVDFSRLAPHGPLKAVFGDALSS